MLPSSFEWPLYLSASYQSGMLQGGRPLLVTTQLPDFVNFNTMAEHSQLLPQSLILSDGHLLYSNQFLPIPSPSVRNDYQNYHQLPSVHESLLTSTGPLPPAQSQLTTTLNFFPASVEEHLSTGAPQPHGSPNSSFEIDGAVLAGTPKKHECPQCSFSTNWPQSFEDHMRRHRGERPFSCPHCGKGFSAPSTLHSHVTIVHGEPKYQCEVCQKRFLTPFKLKTHQTIHTGEKEHKCPICNYESNQKFNLKRHVEIMHVHEVHSDHYVCELCSTYSTNERAELVKHLMYEH